MDRSGYGFAASLAATALESLFEHPVVRAVHPLIPC